MCPVWLPISVANKGVKYMPYKPKVKIASTISGCVINFEYALWSNAKIHSLRLLWLGLFWAGSARRARVMGVPKMIKIGAIMESVMC